MTLKQLHDEAVLIRKIYSKADQDKINFDDWLHERGWSRYEFEFNLQLYKDLIESTKRRNDFGEDDE